MLPSRPVLFQISNQAKAHGRQNSLSLNEIAASGACQSCTRFPELTEYIDGDLPTSFDWRDYDAVTLVKNQVGVLERSLCPTANLFCKDKKLFFCMKVAEQANARYRCVSKVGELLRGGGGVLSAPDQVRDKSI